MPAMSETLLLLVVGVFCVTLLAISMLVVKSRGSKPIKLEVRGLGVSFELKPIEEGVTNEAKNEVVR